MHLKMHIKILMHIVEFLVEAHGFLISFLILGFSFSLGDKGNKMSLPVTYSYPAPRT